MKIWGFNCYGICVARIAYENIEKWNQTHIIASEKIVSWKE